MFLQYINELNENLQYPMSFWVRSISTNPWVYRFINDIDNTASTLIIDDQGPTHGELTYLSDRNIGLCVLCMI